MPQRPSAAANAATAAVSPARTARFRDWVTADGSSRRSRPRPGRYHLYVSWACPWAHRTIIVRELKGLEDAIGMSVVDPIRDERGWAFTRAPSTTATRQRLRLPLARPTPPPTRTSTAASRVPVLWDTQTGRIVNNESADILRMLNDGLRRVRRRTPADLYPEPTCAPRSTRSTSASTTNVNNGVYRAGFATQPGGLRGGRGRAVRRRSTSSTSGCADRRYLFGDAHDARPTGACSPRCCASTPSTTSHFKCNLRRIVDYPNLWPLPARPLPAAGRRRDRRLRPDQAPLLLHARRINPTRIVPDGPALDFGEPHEREALAA